MSVEDYTIEEHQHRLACWAASRAASASPKCRFKVRFGVDLIEGVGINADVKIPATAKLFDAWHKETCKRLITLAQEREAEFNNKGKTKKSAKECFTYGVAAKLLNCYLKVRFVHPCNKSRSVDFIHPPIDRLLLNALYAEDKKDERYKKFTPDWRRFRDIGWSKFDEDNYLEVIKTVKERMNGDPLWRIEFCWEGKQK